MKGQQHWAPNSSTPLIPRLEYEMKLVLLLIFSALLLACSGEAAENPTPEAVLRTPTPEPTPIIFPTPLPTPTAAPTIDISGIRGDLETLKALIGGSTSLSEPNNQIEGVENGDASYETTPDTESPVPDVPENTENDQATAETPTVTPSPTSTPVPTPTPKVGVYAVAPPSAAALGITNGGTTLIETPSYFIQWSGDDLRKISVSGVFTNRADLKPTSIQIWQALLEDGTRDCSTERPIAFIRPGDGSQTGLAIATTPHRWRYCGSPGRKVTYSSDVPWFFASSWSWEERKRRRTTEPHIYDWSMSADFSGIESLDLEYRNPSGWRIIIFAGETILGYFWVGM